MKKSNRKSVSETFAETIIEELKNGTAPWQKPWKAGECTRSLNPVTGTVYKGVNTVMLARHGYADPRWMTMKQANDQEWRVKKGSKAQQVVFWQWTDRKAVLDDAGQPVKDEKGEEKKENVQLERPRLHVFSVFHVSQLQTLDGQDLPAYEPPELGWDPIERGEEILRDSGAAITHDQSDRAFYRIATDDIHLPPRENFPEAGNYYSTALHELSHWTGHESRMGREFGPHGSEVYAKEELRAEIASWMINQELGLPHQPDQHVSYVDSWVSVLQKDPYEIMRACRDAEKIKEYVMNLQQELTVPQPEAGIVMASETPEVQQSAATLSPEVAPADQVVAETKTFLSVPYKEKNQAKNAGAKWDRETKLWYVPEGAPLTALAAWLPEKESAVAASSSGLPPADEFAQTLQQAGLIVDEPVLDGQIHRVPVEGGKPGGKDGAYCGYADGRPNGWGQNHKSGEQVKWIATGHSLTVEQKDALRTEASERLAERANERKEQQAKAMKRAYAKWMNAEPTEEHPYLQEKGVSGFGLKQDSRGNLLIPGFDLRTGRVQTLQWIEQNGTKRFESGCPQQGAALVLPSPDALEGGEILIAEGYATAASLHMATGQPVVAAFTAHNLLPVAELLHEKYPQAEITICADNDHHLPEQINGIPLGNVGMKRAQEAAQVVGATVIAPSFTKEEKIKKYTDFNDLHKSRGLDAVTKRVTTRVVEVAR